MKRATAMIALLLVLGSAALAGSGGSYELVSYTVDGGGGRSTGSDYGLVSTAGQPDAGLLAGAAFTLSGGFWGGGAAPVETYVVYLPVVMRGGSP